MVKTPKQHRTGRSRAAQRRRAHDLKALNFNGASASRQPAMVSRDVRRRVTSVLAQRLEVDDADAQALIKAVSPMWPGGRWSVRRSGPVSAACSWLVLPSLAAPVLLVPPLCPSA